MPPSTTETGQGLRLSVVHPDPQARAEWRQALQSLLPAAQVREWAAAAQGSDPSASAHATGVSPMPGSAPVAHYGVGWRPPAAFFADHPDLAAFLAAGAAYRSVYQTLKAEGSTTQPPVPLHDFKAFSQMMGFDWVADFDARHARPE